MNFICPYCQQQQQLPTAVTKAAQSYIAEYATTCCHRRVAVKPVVAVEVTAYPSIGCECDYWGNKVVDSSVRDVVVAQSQLVIE